MKICHDGLVLEEQQDTMILSSDVVLVHYFPWTKPSLVEWLGNWISASGAPGSEPEGGGRDGP